MKGAANGKAASDPALPKEAEPGNSQLAIPTVLDVTASQPNKGKEGELQPSEEAKKRAAMELQLSAAFAQIIAILLRSPLHKHLALTDLEWLVYPPLASQQFVIANVQTKEGGPSFPASVVLWASVSPDVDQKLSTNLTGPMRLRPDEWRSGDQLWLVEVVGDQRLMGPLLGQLATQVFKGRVVKLRTRGPDGNVAIVELADLLKKQEGVAATP